MRKFLEERRQALKGFLGGRGFLRNVSVLAGGTAMAQSLTVLASPFIAHLYSPADFGVFSVYTSTLSIITCIASWRYEVAITLPEDENVAANLTALSLTILAAMSLFWALIMQFLPVSLSVRANLEPLRPYRWFLPIGFLFLGLNQVLSYCVVRNRSFADLAKSKVYQSVGQVGTQIPLGLIGGGPAGLLLGDVIGRLAGALRLGGLLRRQFAGSIHGVSWRNIRQAARRYRRFPLFSTWAVLLNNLAFYAPAILMAAYYGTKVAGWLGLGMTIIGTPLSLISTSVSYVYMAELTRTDGNTPARRKEIFRKVAIRLVAVTLPFLAVIALTAPDILPFIFGDEWHEAARYLQILSPMFLFLTVGSAMFVAIEVLERQDLHLFREIVRLPLMVGPIVLGANLGLEPAQTLVLYSAGTSLFYLFGIGLVWHVNAHSSGVSAPHISTANPL